MNKLYDVLEICLQELENGANVETVLARYPDLAQKLRPILKASIMARSVPVSEPSPEAVRRGRAKLLQHASEMREQKAASRKRTTPIFQRFAIAFVLAAFFLASGTGLVSASSSALPGENLYPVKRTWEDVRLFFTFNPDRKELLANEFESERLNEVSELLSEGRDETIQYAGVFMQVNGVTYVSGVTVLLPANLQTPANGTAVIVTGQTNAQGFVEIESIELLPAGVVVPVGTPVEVDNESNSNSESGSEDGAGLGTTNEAQGNDVSATPESESQSFEMTATVESISNNILTTNGQTFYLGNAKVEGDLKPGAIVELKGYYAPDGSFVVTEVKVKNSGSGSGGSNENSDSNSGSNTNTNSNDNSGSNSNDGGSNSNDDNGGSSGGNDGGGGGGGGGED